MMYNKYIQYKTLNGIKKDNKMDIVNKLTPVTKNLVRLIPKDQYDHFIKGHQKITYRLIVDTTNRIKNVYLCAWDTVSGSQQITDSKNIPIPNLCYYQGIYDSSKYLPDLLNIQFYNSSDRLMNVDSYPIYSPIDEPPILDPTSGFNASFFSLITQYPTYYGLTMIKTYRSDKYYDAEYDIRSSKSLSYIVIDFTVTNQTYEKLYSIPILTFE